MSNVLSLQPRLIGKRTQLLIDALHYEKTADPSEPIIVIVDTMKQRIEVRRQLQCMVGMRSTRVEVLTATELAARRQREKEQQSNGI